MHGTEHLEELKVLAEGCARIGIPVIEPTGGLTPENVVPVVKACLDAGVDRVMAHVYSSIIDKETGRTNVDLALKTYRNLQALVD